MLGTFSRLARSLATIYIFARVRIFGTLVPFYVTGNSSEFPVTKKSPGHSSHYAGTKFFVVPPDFTDQSSSKANCSVPTALPQLPPPFVIRAIALLTHVGLVVKCLSSLTTLSNKNSSYPTSEYLPPICLISEYGNLFRYSYPLTQESRPQLLGSLSPGVSQTHSIGNSILSSTTDSSL